MKKINPLLICFNHDEEEAVHIKETRVSKEIYHLVEVIRHSMEAISEFIFHLNVYQELVISIFD